MIVKYIWHTEHYNRNRRENKARTWRGWFLFGFIPLYVETLSLTIS